MRPTLPIIIAAAIIVRADLPSRWVRMRQNEIITGTRQVVHPVTSHLTPISCAQRCSFVAWCSAFVTSYPGGNCELLERKGTLLQFSSSPPDTSFVPWETEDNGDWCPVDAGFVLSPAAQFCFLVVNNITKTWIESRNECEKRGLTLVVPDTTLKMNILLNTMETTPGRESMNFHIGASRPVIDLSDNWSGDSATFDWINGARIDKQFLKPFWAHDQPNNVFDRQNCLTIFGSLNYLLNDFHCNEDGHFICEKRRH